MPRHNGMSYRGSWPMPLNNLGGETSQDVTTPKSENRSLLHHDFRYPPVITPVQDLAPYNHLNSPNGGVGSWHFRRSLPAHSVGIQGLSPAISLYRRIAMWPTYRRRNKKFYTFGKVFRIAPHEKVGDMTNPKDEKFVTRDCFGRRVICKPRICIVVEEHKGFCNVVTINGYSDQSLDKQSTNASEHAVARTVVDLSPPSSEEFPNKAGRMLQQPICITPGVVGDRLSFLRRGSVVDFGRVMTVQHYHEAEDFGFVTHESLEALRNHYTNFRNKCATSKKTGVPKENSISPTLGSILALPRMELNSNSLDPGRAMTWTSPHPTSRTIADCLNNQQTPYIHRYISNSVGTEEERDGAFKQQPREFFSYGKVFRLLSWLEEPMDEESEITQMIPVESEGGVPVLRRVLWLVVVQEGTESCKCLRILTYEGRGVSELPPGVSIGEHSIIHTGRQIPDPLPNEIPLNPSERSMGLPIRVRSDNRMEKLFPTARLLWTRVYDVRLDVKAKAFGRVSSRCDYVMEHQFRQLNPRSSINVRHQKIAEICLPATSEDGLRCKAQKQAEHRVGASQLSYSGDEGSDEGPGSTSESSKLVDDCQKQNTEMTYNPGEAVVLLTGKDGPSSGPTLKTFVINTARVKLNDDKELVWEYNLNYPHGGRFSGGRYFDEELLWPA